MFISIKLSLYFRMIYFIVALLPEAKPLIKNLKLTLLRQTPFQIYGDEDSKLIITGIGKENALMATTHLLTHYSPMSSDILVNFGLAGAHKNFEIGEMILAHTLINAATNKKFYPDMRLSHPYKEVKLTTLSEVQTTPDPDVEVVDMEAYSVFQAALMFLKSSQLLTLKIISDHFSAVIPDKEQVDRWITPHLELLMALLKNYQEQLPKKLYYSQTLQDEIDKTTALLKLTNSQINQLQDQVKGYILRHGHEPLFPKHLSGFTQHKKEKKDAFIKLIDLLAL